MGIAEYTGIRCPARQVFINKVVNYKPTEFFPDIENKMWKSVLHGGHPGIIKAVYITAAGFFFASTAGSVVPRFHGNANHFIAFIVEHQSSNGTVNTAAH